MGRVHPRGQGAKKGLSQEAHRSHRSVEGDKLSQRVDRGKYGADRRNEAS